MERVKSAELFAAALQHQQAGRWAEAEARYRELLAREQVSPDVHYNLGCLLNATGRNAAAAECFRAALALRPAFPEAANNLGSALRATGQMEEAAAAFRVATAIKPDFALAWNNLGAALKDLGQLDDALACLDRAIAADPKQAAYGSNRAYAVHYSPRRSPADLRREAERWAAVHAAPVRPAVIAHLNDRSPERRLRVGYVSPDFREHCQAMFTLPLLMNHDRAACEIYCYSDAVRPDDYTERIRGFADVWRPVRGLGDEQLAAGIRTDAIDVLVDLTQHMSGNRLPVFARKPAPVQVSWLGYPGTTGLDTIDWRLTDPRLDPPGPHDAHYTERSYRLPDAFWCYDPLSTGPAVRPPPCTSAGRVTFGCLNNFGKLNDEVYALWRRVLAAVPDSRLLLLVPPGQVREPIAAKLGVERERLIFTSFLPRPAYLALHQHIDAMLDPFPYNGHTTSLDALWMGVPVVSLCGETAVARAGLSLLTQVGLADLAVRTGDDYVATAARLVQDRTGLTALRAKLRGRLERSPLMDAARFARNIEAAYRVMWREWCARAA